MKRTLAIKLGALGDVALSLPFLQRLWLQSASDSCVLTTAAFAAFIELAGPAKVITLPNRGWYSTLRMGFQLRRQNFQRVIDLQGNRASRWLTWMAGGQAERAGLWPGWPYTTATSIPRHPLVHTVRRNDELATILQLPEPGQPLDAPLFLAQRVRGWLEQRGLAGKKLVLIHAGCSQAWATKRWPADYFKQVAIAVHGAGYEVIWLGTKEEAALNQRLAAVTGADATGAFSLPELFALGRKAQFALANDSGPMHVLATAGLPVYAFFGPIDSSRSHAFGQESRVLQQNLPCQPCYSKTCKLPGRTHDCMIGLWPEAVLQRLRADGWLSGQS